MTSDAARRVQVDRLKLRELRILLVVTQAGSVARAAKELAISQPAVSRAIADMEDTLGCTPLRRQLAGNRATQYGHALLKRGVAVFDCHRGRCGSGNPV
jgi:DNA-binding transcriptional LysR family regulator